jgi:hypothetical protein
VSHKAGPTTSGTPHLCGGGLTRPPPGWARNFAVLPSGRPTVMPLWHENRGGPRNARVCANPGRSGTFDQAGGWKSGMALESLGNACAEKFDAFM